jgi:aldehyde dehydrogenase (NAD+)
VKSYRTIAAAGELMDRVGASGVYVDGRFAAATSGRLADVISPRSEELIVEVPLAGPRDIERAVTAAGRAFEDGEWPHWSPAERAAALRRLADGLAARADELAELGVEESGFPISFSERAMAAVPAATLRRYADLCESYPFEEQRVGPEFRSLVRREPVGVVAAIPPFNGPLALGVQKAAPALAAGCTIVLKAPMQNPLTCYVLAEVAEEAGLPPGVLNVLVADVAESEQLVTHARVDKVSLTGSTAVGKRIAELCGRDLRRVTLELGGKSPAIMLDDVDLETAVPGIVACSVGRLQGQVCTAQTRILAPRARYDEIVEAFAEHIAALAVGDPADPDTVVGPLITRAHRERVERYIRAGCEEGASLRVGGRRPAHLDRGWYVEPTLFADATNAMRISREEIFGPVAAVIPHDGLEDAVAIANDSPFGLSATVWSEDRDAALKVARRVRSGHVCLNAYIVDADAPFGGYKDSGIGREMGVEGMDAYVELKSISEPAA